MSLLDDARVTRTRPGPVCSFRQLERSDPTLYAELLEALPHIGVDTTGRAISAQLHRRGVQIADETIMRHFNGRCVTCRS